MFTMHILKSIFISTIPVVFISAIAYGSYDLFQNGSNLVSIGILLSALPISVGGISMMLFNNLARTSAHLPIFSILAVIGLVITILGYFDYRTSEQSGSNLIGLCFSIGSFASFFLYNYWYSLWSRGDNQKLEIGKSLPRFTVHDIDSNIVSSEEFLGKPAIFLFYRGNWCPFCMAQIKEIAAKYQEIIKMGCEVVLISPQPAKSTIKLSKKFEVPLIFLRDEGGRAAKKLGINSVRGLPAGMEVLGYEKDVPYPSVIVTNQKGLIIYLSLPENYRRRPQPDEFIRELAKIIPL